MPLITTLVFSTLTDYGSINPDLTKAAFEKLSKHLWYLSEDLIALSLFNSRVPMTAKRLMVKAIRQINGKVNSPKRLDDTAKNLNGRKFETFASKKSMKLLELMNLPIAFLEADPETWVLRDDFCQALDVVKALNVVNDHAERSIALIQEYSGLLTRDEKQLQFLLQVVENHHRSYSDSRKQTLTVAME